MKFPTFMRKASTNADPAAGQGQSSTVVVDPLFTEQFKALRARIEYKVDMHKVKVIAVTSSIAGEGKTVACANLAPNLAKTGRKKVLLIDTDMRKSDLASRMEIAARPGLSEYLSGSVPVEAILRNSGVPGLYVIPAGARINAPADLLAGERFRELLAGARRNYDVVFLDTPPLIPVADTLALRELADGFIFLFRIGLTPHALLAQAVDDIGIDKVIGVVLNGVEPHKEKYYEKYYGRYYHKTGSEEQGA